MFEIKVDVIDDKTVSFEYPEDLINGHKSLKKIYHINDSGVSVKKDDKEVSIKCPKYVSRPIIMFDTMININSRELQGIGFVVNGVKSKNLRKFLSKNIPIDKYHSQLEKELVKVLLEALVEEVPYEEQTDISEGYKMMINFLIAGGVK